MIDTTGYKPRVHDAKLHIDAAYSKVLRRILTEGENRPNRTGVGTRAIPAATFQYDLSCGPPLLHGKKIAFKSMIVELAGFLQGQTSKKWYQDRGCNWWDSWCNPLKVPYGHDPETRAKMASEDDLGQVYGAQWRNFMGKTFEDCPDTRIYDGTKNPDYKHLVGFDQLKAVVETLAKDPDSRRMVVSAWNPIEQPGMALPPCHYSWQVLVINGKLHLNWNQRSCDVFLGIPMNIASYGTLALLLCRQFGFTPGLLTGNLGDTHIYENHEAQVHEYLARELKPNLASYELLPGFTSVLEFDPSDILLHDYQPHPAIKAPIAI